MAEEFKAMIRGKCALLTILENTSTDVDIDDIISTFNTAMKLQMRYLVSITLKRNPGSQQIFSLSVMRRENGYSTKEILKLKNNIRK